MKRLALLLLLVPAFAAACGGSSEGGLAEAPTTAPSETPSSEAPSVPEPEPAEPMADDEPAAPQGEEIGEQRGIGGDEPPAEATPAPPPSDGTPREEDTSRPVAPVINGADLDGNPLSLEDFKGTPIVVKVFAEH